MCWEQEDILFLEFLERGAENLRLNLIAGDSNGIVPPEGWSLEWRNQPCSAIRAHSPLLSLVPGVPDKRLAAALETAEDAGIPHLLLPGGWRIVAPECRHDPRHARRTLFDKLASLAMPIDRHLAAYAQFHGNNFYVDRDVLCAEAWEQFSHGSVGIALRYLERAEMCEPNPIAKAVFTCQKQGMRIARLRFSEVAAEPETRASLPAGIQSFLLLAKGWGAGTDREIRRPRARS